MKRVASCFIIAMLVTLVFPINAHADSGPKPSVVIQFENMGDEPCYGTLLADTDHMGPHSAWDGNMDHIDGYGVDSQIWLALATYVDNDGYYFWQECWEIGETKQLEWRYYPPNRFKILLYFPDSDTYAVSGIYESYAFDSYYSVDMSEWAGSADRINAVRSYDYKAEIFSLIVRIVITILIELVVALIFWYREKKQLILIAMINLVTQIILNVLLNVVNYSNGPFAAVGNYILFELLVTVIEMVLYIKLLNKLTAQPLKKGYAISTAVFYAIIANAASFFFGLYLASLLPGVF